MTKEKRFPLCTFSHRVCDPGGIRSVDKGACQRIFKGNSLWYSSGVYLNFIIQKTEELSFGMLQENAAVLFPDRCFSSCRSSFTCYGVCLMENITVLLLYA